MSASLRPCSGTRCTESTVYKPLPPNEQQRCTTTDCMQLACLHLLQSLESIKGIHVQYRAKHAYRNHLQLRHLKLVPSGHKRWHINCEPSCELYRTLSGPPGPKSQKSLEKISRGRRPRGPKKSGKVSKKSRTDIFETFSRLFGLFRDFCQTFWDPGAGGPGRPSSDSCSSREGSQHIKFLGNFPCHQIA